MEHRVLAIIGIIILKRGRENNKRAVRHQQEPLLNLFGTFLLFALYPDITW